MIVQHPLLLVGEQRAVLQRDLFAQRFEARRHDIRRGIGVGVIDGQLEQFPGEETALDGGSLGVREKSLSRLDAQNPQRRLVARQGDCHIERLPRRPFHQLFRRIAPTQTERRDQHRLGGRTTGTQQENQPTEEKSQHTHAATYQCGGQVRKLRSLRTGFVLLEAMIALSILTVVGLALLKLSLSILHPRQWILQQSLSDAYMTYERAYAERYPFEDLVGADSPWPVSTTSSIVKTSQTKEIGKLPGGVAVYGTVSRTRFADVANNDAVANPAAMQIWRVQSVLTYTIGGRTYAKSRTVIRTQ